MRKVIVTTVILMLGVTSIASAQTARPGSTTPSSNLSGTTTDAPVGHRQPRVDQVPSEKNLNNPNNPVNREDAELDRKIKSICRGC